MGIEVDRCWFVDGKHVYEGPDCPHSNKSDELGEILPPGWTVQQN
jgi:hypothetical protein